MKTFKHKNGNTYHQVRQHNTAYGQECSGCAFMPSPLNIIAVSDCASTPECLITALNGDSVDAIFKQVLNS